MCYVLYKHYPISNNSIWWFFSRSVYWALGRLNSLPKVTQQEQGWTGTRSQVSLTVNPRFLTASLSHNEKSLHCPSACLQDISAISVWCCDWPCSCDWLCSLSALHAFPHPFFLHSELFKLWGLEIINLCPTPRSILCPLSLCASPRSLTPVGFLWLPLRLSHRGQWQGSEGRKGESRVFLYLHLPMVSCSMISFLCPFSPRVGKGFLLTLLSGTWSSLASPLNSVLTC